VKYPYVTFDEDADVLYVCLTSAKVSETRKLGDLRLIDYSADGSVVGVEFISASEGVDLSDLPCWDLQAFLALCQGRRQNASTAEECMH